MKRISIVYIVNSLIRTMCIGRTLNQHLQLSIETIPLFENRNRQIEKGSLSLEYVAPPQTLPILTSSEKRATAQGWTKCCQTERTMGSGARPGSLATQAWLGWLLQMPEMPQQEFWMHQLVKTCWTDPRQCLAMSYKWDGQPRGWSWSWNDPDSTFKLICTLPHWPYYTWTQPTPVWVIPQIR